eukprot:12333927-Karenia_brevis.AAC.1
MGGGDLPIESVRESRREEVEFIEGKPVWDLRRIEECLAVTGKPPIKMRWVDTNKSFMQGKYEIRSRMVARNFKGNDK